MATDINVHLGCLSYVPKNNNRTSPFATAIVRIRTAQPAHHNRTHDAIFQSNMNFTWLAIGESASSIDMARSQKTRGYKAPHTASVLVSFHSSVTLSRNHFNLSASCLLLPVSAPRYTLNVSLIDCMVIFSISSMSIDGMLHCIEAS